MNRSGVCRHENVWLPTSTAGGVRSMDRAILKHHNARWESVLIDWAEDNSKTQLVGCSWHSQCGPCQITVQADRASLYCPGLEWGKDRACGYWGTRSTSYNRFQDGWRSYMLKLQTQVIILITSLIQGWGLLPVLCPWSRGEGCYQYYVPDSGVRVATSIMSLIQGWGWLPVLCPWSRGDGGYQYYVPDSGVRVATSIMSLIQGWGLLPVLCPWSRGDGGYQYYVPDSGVRVATSSMSLIQGWGLLPVFCPWFRGEGGYQYSVPDPGVRVATSILSLIQGWGWLPVFCCQTSSSSLLSLCPSWSGKATSNMTPSPFHPTPAIPPPLLPLPSSPYPRAYIIRHPSLHMPCHLHPPLQQSSHQKSRYTTTPSDLTFSSDQLFSILQFAQVIFTCSFRWTSRGFGMAVGKLLPTPNWIVMPSPVCRLFGSHHQSLNYITTDTTGQK